MTHTQRTSSTTTRTVRNVALAASGIGIAAVLTACGPGYGSDARASPGGDTSAGSRADSNGGDTLDSCSLLTGAALSDVVGARVTAQGPAQVVARGRACTYTINEAVSTGRPAGSIDIAAWRGAAFFSPGPIGAPIAGIGDEAQNDSEHGIVLFRVDDTVVQVHVISPDRKAASLDIARAAAHEVAEDATY